MEKPKDEIPTRQPAGGERGLAEALNRELACVVLDESRLHSALGAALEGGGSSAQLLETHPTLLAPSPVFLARSDVVRMEQIVDAVEAVVRTPSYRARALDGAPDPARVDRGARGAFLGFDFHLSPDGPKLIEINTNAGGALLSLYLGAAQRACCDSMEELVGRADVRQVEDRFVEMFREEFRAEHAARELRSVAIVDEQPSAQFLYPEFLLFQRLLQSRGIETRIADPGRLTAKDGRLWLDDLPVDLVYNRLTDFYLESPKNAAVRDALVQGFAVVTPHPRSHALYANKIGLTLLSDPELLQRWGLEAERAEVLARGVPRTIRVSAQNADILWDERKNLFFKPVAGYGSRGTYRGSKLTRRVWTSIVESSYVAQELVRPSERQVAVEGERRALKLDVRCYVYRGEIQLFGARMYRGQATNLRTPGGGLTSVLTVD